MTDRGLQYKSIHSEMILMFSMSYSVTAAVQHKKEHSDSCSN